MGAARRSRQLVKQDVVKAHEIIARAAVTRAVSQGASRASGSGLSKVLAREIAEETQERKSDPGNSCEAGPKVDRVSTNTSCLLCC